MKLKRSLNLLLIFTSLAISCDETGESKLVSLSVHGSPAKATNIEVEDDGLERHGSFSLLTYNIAGLPWVVSSSDPVENTPLIGPLLNDYDVVLLQEDFWYHDDLIPEITLPYRSVPQDTDPTVFDLHDGLNRFSNFQFQTHERHTWTECAGHLTDSCDCLARKGFSSAKMTIGEGTVVRIYNVHFDAGESATDVAARQSQFRQLADDLKQKTNGDAIIIGGDINLVDTDSRDLKNLDIFLKETGLTDTCRELNCTDEKFDKVLFRSSDSLTLSIASRAVPDFLNDANEELSDHKPVSIVFKWHRNRR